MKRFYCILTLLIICFHAYIFAQNAENKVDSRGYKTGYWIHNSPDGKVKLEEGNYVDDKKDGVWKAYFPDGKIKHEITYIKGAAKGYAKMYYADGTLREEGTWNEICWVGDYRYYYPNGQAAYVWKYNRQGKREGEQRYYWENGKPKYRGEWENGKVKTNVEVYDSTGTMIQNRIYKDGAFTESLETNSSFLNSDKTYSTFTGTGWNTMYRLDMQIDQKGYFEEGKLIKGESYEYDDNGKLRQIKVYEKGKVVKVNPVND